MAKDQTDSKGYLISTVLFFLTGLIYVYGIWEKPNLGEKVSAFLFFLTAAFCLYYYLIKRKEENDNG